jgi:hypothetical protein
MRIWLGFLALLLPAVPAADEPRPSQAAGLQVDRAAIDFGSVPRLATREARIQLRNDGNSPVRIESTDSDCTCLHSDLAVRQLEPGTTADWKIVLNTCDYVGEVRRHVWLDCDAPDARRLQVAVRYQVVPELFIEPEFVALGLIGDEPIESVVEVKTLSEQPFYLGKATCDDPRVEAVVADPEVTRTEPGRILLRVNPPVPVGRYRPAVWLETTSLEIPKLRIPLYGESIQGIRSTCREVSFGEVPFAVQKTQRVSFLVDAGVSIGGIRIADRSAEVASIERGPERTDVTLRTSRKLPLGEFRGFLILEVNNGGNHKIKLPYRGRVIAAESLRSSGQAHAPSTQTSR